MLPVVICEPSEKLRSRWLNLLTELIRTEYPSLRIEALLGTEADLIRMTEFEAGVMLVLLAVGSHLEQSAQLYAKVMAKNRDNYVLVCLHDVQQIRAVASRFLRPAGMIIEPFEDDHVRRTLHQILSDYVVQYAPQETDECITVLSGKTMHRIRLKDISYLEASDKLVNICTNRRLVVVRGSLATMEQSLGDSFIRCHRAFIVNRSCIESFDCHDMMLTLKDGERLPVSRSCREALMNLFTKE